MKDYCYDFVIVGAGIIGLSVAYKIYQKYGKTVSILIIEKEADIAQHASGRNSGVIHAGIYYAKDSLKAKFCLEGGLALKRFCIENGIAVNHCGKLIVTKNEQEEAALGVLYQGAKNNGARVSIIDQKEVAEIDPNVKTYQRAIWSPKTASLLPKEVCYKLYSILTDAGVDFLFSAKASSIDIHKRQICTANHTISYGKMINSSGLYADKIARFCGIGMDYALLPFKGLYLISQSDEIQLKTNVYPLPDSDYPFLGVHFTITGDGKTKVGPTALPALWREHYSRLNQFNLTEFCEITAWYVKSFALNSFGFRKLLKKEARYLIQSNLLKDAQKMVCFKLNKSQFSKSVPGIRAQLYNKRTKMLVDDFIVKSKQDTIHILNAVSPAFTSAFAVADYVIEFLQ